MKKSSSICLTKTEHSNWKFVEVALSDYTRSHSIAHFRERSVSYHQRLCQPEIWGYVRGELVLPAAPVVLPGSR